MEPSKIIIFSAPSGSGKTTIVKQILQKHPEMEFSISATSRRPREGENHASDYYFISVEEFRRKINANAFVEWEEVYEDCYYGTLQSELDRIWAKNHIPVFDVDVKGGLNLKNIFGTKAIAIFIQPPSLQILEERLRNRSTDTEESIRKRIDKANWELGFANDFDHIIINDQLQDAVDQAENLINTFLRDQAR